jgi:hypothetical protein
VVVSVIVTPEIRVRSVPFGKVRKIWLPATPASRPVDDALNPTV